MVACNGELELRDVLEIILPHKSSLDLVAACECLELAFRPAPSVFRLGCCHEARAAQSSEIGRVSLGPRVGEGFDCRSAVIITCGPDDGVEECRLAVPASAVEEEKRMLTREPGER